MATGGKLRLQNALPVMSLIDKDNTMVNGSAILFYVFSILLLGSAVWVVTSRNTVHSVLFLILSFLNAAGLFLLLHAEFLAMILVIVYVGAVAVLFLFIVMMLNGSQQTS